MTKQPADNLWPNLTQPLIGARSKQKIKILLTILLVLMSPGFLTPWAGAEHRKSNIEKNILKFIVSDDFKGLAGDKRCGDQKEYHVYLIDSFGQRIEIIPEIHTTHGEMVEKLLRSGRDDIRVTIYNTSLSRGLAQVIDDIRDGGCADAVISSTPGSNYTYEQISGLLFHREKIDRHNILAYRDELKQLVRQIAVSGFPSVKWLEQVDLNSVKLKNDAIKYMFIEALGQLNIPVILPYGNADTMHRGRIRNVNLLSLADNAMTYSALDKNGNRIPGFPYSPLSSGDETAEYDVIECPDKSDPFKTVIDINNDGYPDYSFARTGVISYRNEQGYLFFAPAVLTEARFEKWLNRLKTQQPPSINQEKVLTQHQFNRLKQTFHQYKDHTVQKQYVWLNKVGPGTIFEFNAACRTRGRILGTSVIPPIKVKQLLPRKL